GARATRGRTGENGGSPQTGHKRNRFPGGRTDAPEWSGAVHHLREIIMSIKTILFASALALAAIGGTAQAQEIQRIGGAPGGPFVSVTGVPMGGGMTMYFVSGALPTPVTPPANGQPANWGDTTAQTKSVFENIKKSMAAAGLGLGDVVKAT